jgi:5-methylcytosine-specific restriction endonuclease McrA
MACQRAYHKMWLKTPRGRMAVKAQHANEDMKGVTVKIVQRVYEDNIKKYETLTCYLCEKPIEFKQDSLEHKTPFSRGGTNEYSNLAIAHLSCNIKKGTKTELEYKRKLKNA